MKNQNLFRALVNNETSWLAIMTWVEEQEKGAIDSLLSASEPKDFYIKQGEMRILRKLKGLKANANVK